MHVWGTIQLNPPTLDLFHTGGGKQAVMQMRRVIQYVKILSCILLVYMVNSCLLNSVLNDLK